MLVHALHDHLSVVPPDEKLAKKPYVLRLRPPLPPRVRVYLYNATQHPSERQQGAFRIQLTSKDNPVPFSDSPRYTFNRSDGIRCLLMGYNSDLRAFILWDADLHDAPPGYSFSRGVQAPPGVVFRAVARGMAEEQRHLKDGNRVETIIVARPERLAEAIERRVDLSLASLRGGAETC
ncbi:hypothetical protein [Streptomyces lavendulocolor]|uniref:hypothetical protein n=1 Tax=Streptomyces lavendulocolor TaxID=67316 RepID=UPI003C2F83C6